LDNGCNFAALNTNKENFAMPIANVVKSGDSQTICLPKEFHLTAGEVEVFRRGNEIVLREHKASAEKIFDILTSFPDDFMAGGRIDTKPQERDSLHRVDLRP